MEEPTEYAKSVLVALTNTGKHVYAGTVPDHVIARRRTKNRAALVSRRTNRGNR
jgi:hypothetical protein